MYLTLAALLIHTLEVVVVLRAIQHPNREPASRIAWIAVVTAVPVVGVVAYLLFGEVNIGRRRVAKRREIIAKLPRPSESQLAGIEGRSEPNEQFLHLFQMGKSISGFEPLPGNSAQLLADSNATINSMVADIDAAEDHVHLLFYIWLTDNNGCKVIEALKRAAARGVQCRAMVDDLGSRLLIRSPHWQAMQDAGVHVAIALRIGNPLLRPLHGRIDLRNHRKIVIIDNKVTYCGSQNCADPEFQVKAKYAPWVDAVMRFEGPVVLQNQFVFASDWMAAVDEDLTPLLKQQPALQDGGFLAQVVATGPTIRFSAMPQMFAALIHAARTELVITTPYFVPNEAMQSALCAAGYRGVDTTIVFPARCDSRIVAGASRSYYRALLEAGVKIYEYDGGLLHTKSLAVDAEVTLIGSANMDRRSFDLNYENNILLHCPSQTAVMRARQNEYIQSSRLVTLEEVDAWSIPRQLWNNIMAMLGPIL